MPFEFYLPILVPIAGDRVVAVASRWDDNRTDLAVSDGTLAGTRLFVTLVGSTLDPPPAIGLGSRLLLFQPTYPEPGATCCWPTRPPASTRRWCTPASCRASPPPAIGPSSAPPRTGSGAELWVTDGSPAGTRLLEIRPGIASSLGPEVEIYPLGDGRVAFAADDGVAGNELWISDGTPPAPSG